MSTLRTDTLSNSAGSASVSMNSVINGCAKAWVNFNGTGTVAIRAAFNVQSITDNGTGNYTANFTTALADSNYSAVATGNLRSGIGDFISVAPVTSSNVSIFTSAANSGGNIGGVRADNDNVNLAVFR